MCLRTAKLACLMSVQVDIHIASRNAGRTIPATCAMPSQSHTVHGNKKLPLVVFYHSGGMIIGSIGMELSLTRYLAHSVGAVVCSVEYRLAPENTYPAVTGEQVPHTASI